MNALFTYEIRSIANGCGPSDNERMVKTWPDPCGERVRRRPFTPFALGFNTMTNHPLVPSQSDDFHHLRSHLTMIKGYAQLIRREARRAHSTNPRIEQFSETVLAHIELLTRQIASMEAKMSGNGESAHDDSDERPPENSE